PDNENHIVKTTRDLMNRRDDRNRPRSAGGLRMERRDAAKPRINVTEITTQVKLSGELPGSKVPHNTRLNIGRTNAGINDSGLTNFNNDIAQRTPLLAQIPLEVGTTGAEKIDRFRHAKTPQKGKRNLRRFFPEFHSTRKNIRYTGLSMPRPMAKNQAS